MGLLTTQLQDNNTEVILFQNINEFLEISGLWSNSYAAFYNSNKVNCDSWYVEGGYMRNSYPVLKQVPPA